MARGIQDQQPVAVREPMVGCSFWQETGDWTKPEGWSWQCCREHDGPGLGGGPERGRRARQPFPNRALISKARQPILSTARPSAAPCMQSPSPAQSPAPSHPWSSSPGVAVGTPIPVPRTGPPTWPAVSGPLLHPARTSQQQLTSRWLGILVHLPGLLQSESLQQQP